ncbi:TlpA family protein disulfide reductase [Jongsikchunia kroppenstedtii]|uniref:TlpA family protein disulfide reductase n=1 Tax=Jongsikchunia kroppenstedtii TaxID=1121721 RepID=UPI0003642FDB|nr:TlpA disulfide reductase family protein [Jongsikchunia kroppenstedtii]
MFGRRRDTGTRGTRVRAVGSVFAVLVTAAALLTACGTGKDAVAQGDTFQFVSPGGKLEIFYNPPSSRKPLRNFSGTDVATGNPLALSDFAGKVVVINIWAEWCGPCIAESDELEQVYTSTKDKGVQVLGISFRSDKSKASDFVSNHHMTYPSIYDYSGRTMATWRAPISVVPTTLVVDRQHRAAAVFVRAVTASDLLPLVNRLAAEPIPAAPAAPAGAGQPAAGQPGAPR